MSWKAGASSYSVSGLIMGARGFVMFAGTRIKCGPGSMRVPKGVESVSKSLWTFLLSDREAALRPRRCGGRVARQWLERKTPASMLPSLAPGALCRLPTHPVTTTGRGSATMRCSSPGLCADSPARCTGIAREGEHSCAGLCHPMGQTHISTCCGSELGYAKETSAICPMR